MGGKLQGKYSLRGGPVLIQIMESNLNVHTQMNRDAGSTTPVDLPETTLLEPLLEADGTGFAECFRELGRSGVVST